jgi:hypothetical protein
MQFGGLMYRPLLLLLSILIFSPSVFAEPTIFPKDPSPLGPIKSIKTYDENMILRDNVIYTKKGNIASSSHYDSRGNLYEEHNYVYDPNGQKIKHRHYTLSFSKVINFDSKGNMLEQIYGRSASGKGPTKYIYKYQDNKLDEMIGYLKDGSIWQRRTFTYENEMLIKETRSDKDKPNPSKTIYKYDSKGNNIAKTYYDYDNYISNQWNYEYDEHGNKTKMEEQRYFSGQRRAKYIYLYDKNGNTIEKRIISKDGKLMDRNTYEYNKGDNIIQENAYRDDGSLGATWRFSYNKKGNLIEYKEYFYFEGRNDGLLNRHEVFKYLFDNNGNWIKKTRHNPYLIKPEVWIRIVEYWD